MGFVQLLPLAIVMIAGPQIITSFFLALTPKWLANSVAYVAGAAISVLAWVTIAFLLGSVASDQGTPSDTFDYLLLGLLAVAAVHTFLTRKTSRPPKWMGKLERIQPKGSLRLGLLLFALFPGDIVTAFGVGSHIGGGNDAWWHVLPFVLVTLLLLALPAVAVLLFHHKAEEVLPKARDWMDNNSWVVSEFVLVLFIVMIASGL